MKHYYYPRTHDQITTAVIDMFNDMTIYRYDESTGEIVNTINVPCTFGPVEKTYQFRKEQESGKQYYISLPRIAIVYNGTIQASQRSTSINTERFFLEGQEVADLNYSAFIDYQPVPVDYVYTVYIRTEFFKDYAQILENILPYFAPDSTSLRVREFSFLNIERNLNVKMSSVQANLQYSLDDQNMREVNGEFTITVEGYCYRPVDTSSGIIESVDVKYFFNGAENWFENTLITGYATSAMMPASSAYSTSGINNNNIYYTETEFNQG